MSHSTLLGVITICSLAIFPLASVQDPQATPQPGPLVTFVGADSKIATSRCERITNSDQWAALWLEHTGQPKQGRTFDWFYNREQVPEVDFEQCQVLAVFQGSCWNSAGVRVVEIQADAKGTLVRFDDKPYQTEGPDGGGERATPFGMFVLPRRPGPIVLEENVQILSGQPPQWQQRATL